VRGPENEPDSETELGVVLNHKPKNLFCTLTLMEHADQFQLS
jgi:hypothetical protein